jgi:hypothetical protein
LYRRLLALFGEKVAQQFMSESLSWLDHIIFAMAPLGIITAIVAAIRIGGPSWMRAIIGRARESRSSAEVELMSSTSHEVCELWNGESVVRMLGRPKVKQLAVLRREMHDEETFGLYTLEAAQRAQVMEWKGWMFRLPCNVFSGLILFSVSRPIDTAVVEDVEAFGAAG